MRSTVHVDILVPVADNESRPFSPASFEAFETFLASISGGFTDRGLVDGAWMSPMSGMLLRDRSRSYSITIDAESAFAQVKQVDSYIKQFFRQEAAFLELIPTRATAF